MGLKGIKLRIENAELAANRTLGSTRVIAVSKVQPNFRVEAVLNQGQRLYGENRVQEAAGKWPDFREQFDAIEVHLIGPLQSNKARQAMNLFECIHTLDRLKLATNLARLAQEIGHCPDLFIQINTGEEQQKVGILAQDADRFIETCRKLDLPVLGLMCLPPVEEEPALHFALLAKIARRNGLTGLSMGMSGDFETAIAQGSTHIRVGSAIFGERTPV